MPVGLVTVVVDSLGDTEVVGAAVVVGLVTAVVVGLVAVVVSVGAVRVVVTDVVGTVVVWLASL